MQAVTSHNITSLQILFLALYLPHPSCITHEDPIQGTVLCRKTSIFSGRETSILGEKVIRDLMHQNLLNRASYFVIAGA